MDNNKLCAGKIPPFKRLVAESSGEASLIFSHAMQIFLCSKTVKTMNFYRNE